MSRASYSEAHREMARAMLDRGGSVPSTLGEIALREHQQVAAQRLVTMIGAHGGAVLAEPVGVGKTYTALATAAHFGGRAIIAVPSALQEMWSESLAACGLTAQIVTHESLSRGVQPNGAADFVIVDEAHRLRNPATRRYALLAELCRRAKLLLVTATPVQNRRADLAAQIALFAGRAAWQFSDDELAAFVVRDSSAALHGQPRLEGPRVIELETRDDCLDQLLALPAPVPAKDETLAMALVTYGLLHQWTSSRAALTAALCRRRARGLALREALEQGRQPTRAELSAWTHASDSLQLAFPELVTAEALDPATDSRTLLDSLERHLAGVESLLVSLRSTDNPDVERAAALRKLRGAHPGERIIAFCHYAETVNALRTHLLRDSGIAALTAGGARIASGRVARSEVLEQFAPLAGFESRADPANRIELLLTTDLLSEGLNLQEASVIVHLDLPWNPARLEQRVGRALRLGSRHPVVTVYTVAPPAAAERMLQIERRLRAKLSVAQRTVGIAGRILPSIAVHAPGRGLAEQRSEIDSVLARWLGPPEPANANASAGANVSLEPWASPGARVPSPPAISSSPRRSTDSPPSLGSLDVSAAAVRSEYVGFLAVVRDGRGATLVAGTESEIDARMEFVRRAVAACDRESIEVDAERLAAAMRRLTAWLAARQGELTIDFHAAANARSRRAALTRVAQSLSRMPRHRRSLLAPLAAAARAVATAPLAEGAERILETLVGAALPDEAWLRSIATFGELNTRQQDQTAQVFAGSAVVLSIILLQLSSSALQS